MTFARVVMSSVAPPLATVKRAILDTIGEPSVNDRNTCPLLAKLGWNAMPSKPPSEFAFTVTDANVLAALTLCVIREHAHAGDAVRPRLLEHEPTRVVAGRLQHQRAVD